MGCFGWLSGVRGDGGRGRSLDEVDVWTSEVDGGKWWCCGLVSALDMATYLHRPVMLTMIALL
jgi:hypothetical protein